MAVEYYNSGSWTDEQATYITVGFEGVRIQEYKDPNGVTDPNESAREFSNDAESQDETEMELAGSPT